MLTNLLDLECGRFPLKLGLSVGECPPEAGAGAGAGWNPPWLWTCHRSKTWACVAGIAHADC